MTVWWLFCLYVHILGCRRPFRTIQSGPNLSPWCLRRYPSCVWRWNHRRCSSEWPKSAGRSSMIAGRVHSGSLFFSWSWSYCTNSYVDFLRDHPSIHLKSSDKTNALLQMDVAYLIWWLGTSNNKPYADHTNTYMCIKFLGPSHVPFIFFYGFQICIRPKFNMKQITSTLFVNK